VTTPTLLEVAETYCFVVAGLRRIGSGFSARRETLRDYAELSGSLQRRNLDGVTPNSGQHAAEDESMKR
jgi:hypothetical protein